MSNGGVVFVYKREGDCESEEVIHEASKDGFLEWLSIFDVEVVAEMELGKILAGIGVTSDWVLVSNKDSVCKGELLIEQDVIVAEEL